MNTSSSFISLKHKFDVQPGTCKANLNVSSWSGRLFFPLGVRNFKLVHRDLLKCLQELLGKGRCSNMLWQLFFSRSCVSKNPVMFVSCEHLLHCVAIGGEYVM